MADRIVKPDTGNDLVLQNDDASAKIEINEDGSIPVTGTFDVSSATLTTSSAQKTAIVDGGKGNLTKTDVGLSNVTNDAQVPASGGTFSGNVSFGDNNITNVGNIAVDTISSDAGTSIGVNLGTDAGDDFNVGSGKLVVEGDTGNIGIGTTDPARRLEIFGDRNAIIRLSNNRTSESPNEILGSLEFFSSDSSGTGANVRSTITARTDGAGNESYLTFSTADGTTDDVERMRIDNSGNLKFNSGYGSVATAYACRAWVNFDGGNAFSPNPSTSAIRGSGNVTSITYTATGRFTVNFTNPMPDTNYAMAGSSGNNGTTSTGRSINRDGVWTTTAMQIRVATESSSYDDAYIGIAVFR